MIQDRKQTVQLDRLAQTGSAGLDPNQAPSSLTASLEERASSRSRGIFRGLFDDLSIAQIIAGALAAATVFLLSSVIGVAGSLIGAAIGSVISAISSQVYKKVLSASANKIRDVGPSTLLHDSDGQLQDSDDPLVDVGHLNEAKIGQDTLNEPTRSLSAAAVAMNANDTRYRVHDAEETDPALRLAHARRNHKTKVQHQVLVVSVVSSLLAIIVCAGVIMFATGGSGIGTKPEPIFPSSTIDQPSASHSTTGTSTDSASSSMNTSSNGNTDGYQSSDAASSEHQTITTTTPDQDSSQNAGTTSGSGSSGSGSASSSDAGSKTDTDTGTGDSATSGSEQNGSSTTTGEGNVSGNTVSAGTSNES